MTTGDTAPVRPGEELPLDALREALRGRVAGDVDALSVEQFPGGFSNLTYLVRAGEQEYVLRRAPLGPVPRGAHDMAREAQLLSRVAPVLPVAPRPALLVEDASVIGAPFYLMERRHGVVVRSALPPAYAAMPDAPARLSEALVDTLADLHAVDIDAAGLREIGKPEGFNARQVSGWAGRWRRAREALKDTGDLPPPAVLRDELVIAWLEAHTPPESAHTLVHNDFKLDNVMLDPADPGTVTALLDWEMTTVGDPLVDLGLTLTYWTMPEQPGRAPSAVGAHVPGFLGREAMVARYEIRSGRHVTSSLPWYEVLGHFKLAVIVIQIFARYRAGQTNDPRFAPLAGQAEWLMREAWRRITMLSDVQGGGDVTPAGEPPA
ncbi:aminoglycoside phosphotransferase (APT) family kinase protein [Deinococcus metalli]|uniref:Aminoglycoside phosphotransferase n=1 Tax=Deinococcus metalli TaxID=1141878 RepID=A0A7W8NQF9_9DEIO|nr:phosphotransferase family protein [Deinococcus metalli]MBB5375828.1 aminoglycoside phosphotransferase (APT) family kinase protein [Deinococcus metalli]GHF36733.1 aminoglycoside phosphotransferase [Deinococcus metalli]